MDEHIIGCHQWWSETKTEFASMIRLS